ncbi:hypothetical protein BpHYR1_045184 [Brachionus plicatilis]|uniref:Uncharacterized protein n=1 Tax=Brachionus plicatilis TaxID=10195 RepID=A0A3M7SCW9_BRAPC|nr:hypothetical protein BpHYR1_045184 [Brachionus plicatilis]
MKLSSSWSYSLSSHSLNSYGLGLLDSYFNIFRYQQTPNLAFTLRIYSNFGINSKILKKLSMLLSLNSPKLLFVLGNKSELSRLLLMVLVPYRTKLRFGICSWSSRQRFTKN